MAQTASARQFSPGRTLLFSTILILATIGLLEGALRLVGIARPARPRLLLRSLDVDIDFPFMRPDVELFWFPRPGWTGEFLGQRVSINSLGLRGAEPAIPKKPGRRRVATFGDSITFGYGVNDDDTYAHQLGTLLADGGVETINAGVTGYTSHQVLHLLRRLAPVLGLDVATFCIGWNDGTRRPLDDRQFAARLRSSMAVGETLEHSFLYRGMKNLYLRSALWKTATARDKPRVSIAQYRENMREIVRVCRDAGVKPVFVSLPRRRQAGEARFPSPYADEMSAVASNLGVPLLTSGELGLDATAERNDRFFIDTLHLSVEGHALLAREIARQLEERGLVP